METVDDYPLFRVERAVRATDPPTSKMAAEAIAPHVRKDQLVVLIVLYGQRYAEPVDDFQLAEFLQRKQTSIGVRRKELERAGFVEKAGRRVSPSSLTNSVVQSYRITAAGVAFYEREGNK